MYSRTSSHKLTKRIKLLLVQKSMDQETLAKSTGLTAGATAEDVFVKSVIDPRLSAEENTILVHKLLEVREAFVAMLLSNRETSHSNDFVAG